MATEITKRIRETSQTRNDPSTKLLREIDKKISEASAIVTNGFNSTVDKEKLLESLGDTAASLNVFV